jgi:hypothetical protein
MQTTYASYYGKSGQQNNLTKQANSLDYGYKSDIIRKNSRTPDRVNPTNPSMNFEPRFGQVSQHIIKDPREQAYPSGMNDANEEDPQQAYKPVVKNSQRERDYHNSPDILSGYEQGRQSNPSLKSKPYDIGYSPADASQPLRNSSVTTYKDNFKGSPEYIRQIRDMKPAGSKKVKDAPYNILAASFPDKGRNSRDVNPQNYKDILASYPERKLAAPLYNPSDSNENRGYEPVNRSGYEPPIRAYEPPSDRGYEPPTKNYEAPPMRAYERPSSGNPREDEGLEQYNREIEEKQQTQPPAILLTCMDCKLQEEMLAFMNRLGYKNNFNQITLAGARLGYNQKKYPDWKSGFESQLDIAEKLNKVKEIICIDHDQCGVYKLLCGSLSAEDERKKHNENISDFEKAMKRRNAGVTVTGFVMYGDGKIERVRL